MLTFTACSAGTSGNKSGGAPGITDSTITIGTSNSLTGPVASVCLPTSAGATAWFKHVNDSGGVHGRKIEDKVLDDGYQAPRAAANVRTFRSDDVFALFGGCGTVTAATIASTVAGTDVPYLFPMAALPELVRPAKHNVFSLLPLYSDQGRALIQHVLGREGPGPIYAITSQIPGYQEDMSGVSDGAKAANARLLDSALLPVTDAPVQQEALKVGNAHPDYLMLTVLGPDSARLLNALGSSGSLPAKGILGVSVLASQSFAAALTPQAAALLRTASPTVPVDDARAAECVAAMRKYEPKTEPDALALFGCATAQVFVAAMDRAGTHPTRAALVAALESMNNEAVSSLLPPVTFSATNHLGLSSMFLLNLVNGRFKDSGTIAVAPAAP